MHKAPFSNPATKYKPKSLKNNFPLSAYSITSDNTTSPFPNAYKHVRDLCIYSSLIAWQISSYKFQIIIFELRSPSDKSELPNLQIHVISRGYFLVERNYF